ncbi:MAG: hypothetical protein AAGE96_14965 [Cyanobacteria bacterium P01_G01_bin.19]
MNINSFKWGIRVRGYLGGDLPYEADSAVQSSHVLVDNNEVYLSNLSNSGENKGLDNQLQFDSPAVDVLASDRSLGVTDNLGDLGALEYGKAPFESGDIV